MHYSHSSTHSHLCPSTLQPHINLSHLRRHLHLHRRLISTSFDLYTHKSTNMASTKLLLFLCLVAVLLFATPTHAFGAGNIASISKIEGKNWRHGDIEDMLKTVDCLKKHKWTSMMIKVGLISVVPKNFFC